MGTRKHKDILIENFDGVCYNSNELLSKFPSNFKNFTQLIMQIFFVIPKYNCVA